MTTEQKQKLLVDYMVEVVRHYDLPEKQFALQLPHIVANVFGHLTDEEYGEWQTWFCDNVPRERYNKYLNAIDAMGLDVELGLVSQETIYHRLKTLDEGEQAW